MKAALFIPCYVDAFFPEVGIATLELLARRAWKSPILSIRPLRTADGHSGVTTTLPPPKAIREEFSRP